MKGHSMGDKLNLGQTYDLYSQKMVTLIVSTKIKKALGFSVLLASKKWRCLKTLALTLF